MIQLRILGRVISKKNNRNLFMRNGRQMNLPNKAYKAFEESALQQLKFNTMTTPTITTPVWVAYEFNIKGKLDIDIDNAMASINDILQKSGIIEDDAQIVQGSFIKRRGQKDWETKISINEVQ